MRRLFRAAIGLAVTVAAAGCGGGGDGEAEGGLGATTSTARATTVPSTAPVSTGPSTDLTLRVNGVRLVNSEESDSGMRVLLPAGVATASVTLTGLPSPNRVISVCQARELDRRLSSAACRTPANGEAVTVTLGAVATGVEIVQVGVSGAGPDGNSAALDEVTIRYAASSRELSARLPQIAAGDAGGRPSFALTPPSADGTYRASLTWTVIQVFGGTVSNGRLELLEGGNVTNQAQGGAAGVQLSGKVPTPAGPFALRVQNTGEAALVSPTLAALLP